jgi:nucleoid-associated protein YgaU
VRYLAFIVLLASVFIAGCASSGPKNPPQQVTNPASQQPAANSAAVQPQEGVQQPEAVQPIKPPEAVEPPPAVKQPEVVQPSAVPAEGSRVHKVWIFETLWGISKKYYGDGKYWETIYEANKDQIADPKVIFPKQELVIPPLEEEK